MQRRQRTHADAWNVAIVVDQTPLLGLQIKPEDVIIDLIGILVESSKGIDLVIADIGDRRIDEAGGLGADC